MNWAGWEARTQDTPGLAQGHLHLAGPRNLLTLTSTILVGETEAEGCSAHWLRRWQEGWGGGAQPLPRDLLPAYPLSWQQEGSGQAAGPGPSPYIHQ